jgi:hypothetical protein
VTRKQTRQARQHKTKMNISTEADNSSAAFPRHGEVMDRMQGAPSYIGHGEGMNDLKNASVLSKPSGELEKAGGVCLKPGIEFKKPGAELDKPSASVDSKMTEVEEAQGQAEPPAVSLQLVLSGRESIHAG